MKIMPLVAMRGMVAFPTMSMTFDIGRERSQAAVDEAMAHDQLLVLAAQRDTEQDDPTEEGLFTMGTVVRVKQLVRHPAEGIRVLVEGVSRAIIHAFPQRDPYFTALVEVVEDSTEPAVDPQVQAAMRGAVELFQEFAQATNRIPPEVLLTVIGANAPGKLADLVASYAVHGLENRQRVLEIIQPEQRLETIMTILHQELEIVTLEQSIQNRVRVSMTEQQKEHFLHEQIRAIYQELGEDGQEKAQAYREKAEELPLPEEAKEKVLRELSRLERLPESSPDYHVLLNWIEWILELPWGKYTQDKEDIAYAKKVLDEDHDGLEKVKDRVLEYLAVLSLTHSLKGPILCLVGPPGVGKTSIAKSIARAMGRKFVRMSLGGLRDEAEIRGHRRTYIGAIPGRIIAGIKQAGTANPLFLLDELDKMSHDFRGDPASAMLEVLDSEQNNTFRDHYLDVPFDLSQVMFLATANSLEEIPEPLMDRMEVIRLEGYTYQEKLRIARNHLLPKQLKLHGLKKSQLAITDKGMEAIIWGYTREAGVRSLEREIGRVCRRAARILVESGKKSLRVTPKNLEQYLGIPQFREEATSHEDTVGLVAGLAWTAVGGVTLAVEVNTMPGTGHLELTGSLGDVMKESASAALGYIRAHAQEYGLDPQFYKSMDIHIHLPEGATPKDGPSAGITMATALLSALTGKAVRGDVAMTGEITIRGRVMAIGGLKEKSMAAHREGYRTVIFPAENLRDLEEIDPVVRQAVSFVPVRTLEEVLSVAFVEGNGKSQPRPVPFKAISEAKDKAPRPVSARG